MKGYKIGLSEDPINLKGYKTGLREDPIDFVLIELDIPEEYPGVILYEYIVPITSRFEIIYRATRQYRTNVARVLDIRKIKDGIVEHVESAVSLYDPTFHYRPGEIIYPKAFDPDRTNMCTDGLHFFETVEEAIKYTEDSWVRCRRTRARLARNNARYIVGIVGGG